MPGIAEGVPGAKAFDELAEQTQGLQVRNQNGGKPPDSRILLENQTPSEFRASVLQSLGIGRNVTGSA